MGFVPLPFEPCDKPLPARGRQTSPVKGASPETFCSKEEKLSFPQSRSDRAEWKFGRRRAGSFGEASFFRKFLRNFRKRNILSFKNLPAFCRKVFANFRKLPGSLREVWRKFYPCKAEVFSKLLGSSRKFLTNFREV